MGLQKRTITRSAIALFEITLLLFAIIAFACIFNATTVSAVDPLTSEVMSGAILPNPSQSSVAPLTEAMQARLTAQRLPGTETIETQVPGGAETGAEAGTGNIAGEIFGGKIFDAELGAGNVVSDLIGGLAWGVVAGGITYMVLSMLGVDEEAVEAASLSIGLGTGIATTGYYQATSVGAENAILGEFFKNAGFTGGGGALLWGIGISIAVFAFTYKEEKLRTVSLQCLPWEAPLGGSDCEKCNADPLKPCSEYRCKSLGQACELRNEGTPEERCVWVSRGDVKSPVIATWNEALTQGHSYTPNNAIRPPNRGFKIVNTARSDGCIKPFTPLRFGIRLDEPAQCKIDIDNGNKTFDEMQFYFGESNYYRYNHTEQLRLPSPGSINAESPEFPTEGTYNFYVKCRDANGNTNEDVFVVNFCVDKTPDTTPPLVESTSITSGSAVRFGVQSVPFTLNVNEPAECRWSAQDKDYSLMENTMSCSAHVYQQNAQELYPCTTTLTGIRDRTENAFFFRCKDQPLKNESERNVNGESYRVTLRGSQTLSILKAGPNATLIGNTEVLPINLTVTTDDGADEGQAICSFSSTGEEGTFISMFETESYQHTQILNLGSGSYTYHFRCVDAGGNAAQTQTSFSVRTDRTPPAVTRVYKESDALKIVTNEAASCVYSLNSCNFVFNEGLPLNYLNSNDHKMHILEWRPNQVHYIKCRDEFGNEPAPNSCSVVVNPSASF